VTSNEQMDFVVASVYSLRQHGVLFQNAELFCSCGQRR
jgi:hypothetical protein